MKSTFKSLALILACAAPAVSPSPSHAQTKGRIATSLLGLFPLGDPSYQKFDDYYLVRGKIFDNAFVQNIYEDGGSATYETNKQYDVFEADIAADCTSTNDNIRFYVLGDGDIIYRSPRLSSVNKPIHISVPIGKYRGVSLVTEAYFRGGLPKAVWADPMFVRTAAGSPLSTLSSRPSATTAPSVAPATSDTLTLSRRSDDSYQVTVNGKPLEFGYVQPQLKEGTLLVPMRPLFEALGATVNFNDESQVVLAKRGGREIQMRIGSKSATVNGRSSPLDVPAQSMLGTTLVPLRFISEAFGVKISFPQLGDDETAPGNNSAY